MLENPLEQWVNNRGEAVNVELEILSPIPSNLASTTMVGLNNDSGKLAQNTSGRRDEDVTMYSTMKGHLQGQTPTMEKVCENFKDIEMSPTRNLNDSFEGSMHSHYLKEDGGSTQASLEDEDSLNDLGLLEVKGIQEERTLEQSNSQKTKPNVGSRKKRGPKPVSVKLEAVGNDAN